MLHDNNIVKWTQGRGGREMSIEFNSGSLYRSKNSLTLNYYMKVKLTSTPLYFDNSVITAADMLLLK